MKSFETLVLVMILAAAVGGCQNSKSEECKAAVAGVAPDAGMLNANCPVMPEDDARGSGVAVAYTGQVVAWKGKQVAFCCDGCTRKWEKMTSAQRDEALAKVAAK